MSKSAIEATAVEANTALEWPKTIEIAGKRILAMPLEAMPLTEAQKIKFLDAGGIIMDMTKISKEEATRIANENPWAMIEWQESFEDLYWYTWVPTDNIMVGGHNPAYTGHKLFKKVYQAFPEYRTISKQQATIAWLYPIVHYRNLAACKWFAEMSGGRLATNDEILDIYKATSGKDNFERLAAMWQAQLGFRSATSGRIGNLGNMSKIGSGTIDQSSMVTGISVERYAPGVNMEIYNSMDATSGVVIMRDE